VELNLAKYFTGRPCVRGHTALRYTKTGACSECVSEYPRRNPTKPDETLIVFKIHKDDEKIVQAYVDALNFQREFEKSS
jgi:hypothetical protein